MLAGVAGARAGVRAGLELAVVDALSVDRLRDFRLRDLRLRDFRLRDLAGAPLGAVDPGKEGCRKN